MRILYVLENYPPHIGGVEMLFARIAEGMAARGHTVTVLTHHIPGTKKDERVNGVRIVRIPCLDTRYLFTFAAIPRAIALARDADIVHTTTYNGAFPAWIGARLRGKPAIITVHETWLGKWRTMTSFSPVRAWVHEVLERCVYLLPFRQYVCVSDATRAELARAIPRRRITTVHNGFDPAFWQRPRKEAAAIRKRFRTKHLALAYGRPGASKGFEYLIDAWPFVKHRYPDAVLALILSRDPQYRTKIDAFKARGLPDVLFLEPQPYDKLPAYVQAADCIVVPSLSEGFGYAVVEANAAGTPVVASRVASIPEVISGRHVLVPPRDASALADGIVQVFRGKAVRTPPKRFPWEATLDGYERIYRASGTRRAR